MKLSEEDASLSFEEVEKKYGITETRNDTIPFVYEEADFEASHRRADKDLAWLTAHLGKE